MNLTDEQKKIVRENTSMKMFNFYLDDVTKLEVLQKLREHGLDTKKGTLSALIRVLLRQFAETDLAEWVEMTCSQVEEEYTFTTKKNKRSSM